MVPTMKTLPSGNEAALLGCQIAGGIASEKIHKLFWENGELKWKTLPNTVKNPRSSTVAMFIPNTLFKHDNIEYEYCDTIDCDSNGSCVVSITLYKI